jgi:hypothetical protein
VLGAAASLDRAKAVMADCFHLNARARETVAGKVKEQGTDSRLVEREEEGQRHLRGR